MYLKESYRYFHLQGDISYSTYIIVQINYTQQKISGNPLLEIINFIKLHKFRKKYKIEYVIVTG